MQHGWKFHRSRDGVHLNRSALGWSVTCFELSRNWVLCYIRTLLCNEVYLPLKKRSCFFVKFWPSSLDWIYGSVPKPTSNKKVKVSSYITQYPVLKFLHFTFLTDLFNQTPSQCLWEASSHMLQLMRDDCAYTYPPLSIARYSYSWVNWSNVEWKNLPEVLTPKHRIRTRVLLVESPKLYPWATAFYINCLSCSLNRCFLRV